jgi:hypothetical protein
MPLAVWSVALANKYTNFHRPNTYDYVVIRGCLLILIGAPDVRGAPRPVLGYCRSQLIAGGSLQKGGLSKTGPRDDVILGPCVVVLISWAMDVSIEASTPP